MSIEYIPYCIFSRSLRNVCPKANLNLFDVNMMLPECQIMLLLPVNMSRAPPCILGRHFVPRSVCKVDLCRKWRGKKMCKSKTILHSEQLASFCLDVCIDPRFAIIEMMIISVSDWNWMQFLACCYVNHNFDLLTFSAQPMPHHQAIPLQLYNSRHALHAVFSHPLRTFYDLMHLEHSWYHSFDSVTTWTFRLKQSFLPNSQST